MASLCVFDFSRRVNPDPDVDDEEELENEDILPPMLDKRNSMNYDAMKPMKPGLNKFGRKNLSSITLHSKVFDLTFDK